MKKKIISCPGKGSHKQRVLSRNMKKESQFRIVGEELGLLGMKRWVEHSGGDWKKESASSKGGSPEM